MTKILTADSGQARFIGRAVEAWEPEATDGFYSDGVAVFASVDSAVVGSAYPYTIGGWFFVLDGIASYITLCDSSAANQRVYVGISATKQPRIFIEGGASSQTLSASAVTAGSWAHIAFVFTSATSRDIYVNGAFAVSGSISVTPSGLDNTSFGAAIKSVDQYFEGEYKEASFYNSALTAAQILAWYNGTAPASPAAYYPCDEAGGLVLNDTSGNDKHMTIYGLGDGVVYRTKDSAGLPLADAIKRGLLMEREATNRALYTNDIASGNGWVQTNVTISTVEDDTFPGSVYEVYADTSDDSHRFYRTHTSFTAGVRRATSIFIKQPSFTGSFAIRMVQVNGAHQWFNFVDGVEGITLGNSYLHGTGVKHDAGVIPLGNGWFKLFMSSTGDNAGSLHVQFNMGADDAANFPAEYIGVPANIVRFAGISVYEEAYPFSYIDTGSSTITRSGDLCRADATQAPWNRLTATRGTLSAEIELHGVSATSGDERVVFDLGGDVRLYIDDAGVLTGTDGTNTVTAGTISANTRHAVEWSWSGSEQQVSLDGTAGTKGTWAGTLGSTFGIGCDADADADQLDGTIRNLVINPAAEI